MSDKLKSISDTYIFKLYDKQIELQKTMMRILTEGELITDARPEIKDMIGEIDRRYHYSSKNFVLDCLRKGKIKLVMNAKQYRLPTTIPCYLANTGKSIVCVVNISNHATYGKDNEIKMDTKNLFYLLQCGATLISCYENYRAISMRAEVQQLSSSMFSKLCLKIFNRMFSISINRERQDIVTYLTSYYFLYNVMGRRSQSMQEMNKKFAIGNCKSSGVLLVNDIDRNIKPEEHFKDLDAFIKFVAENVGGMRELTTRQFVDNYVNSYGAAMMLSLEFLPTFYHNLFAVVIGSYTNVQNVIENTLDAEIDKLYRTFFSSISQ